MSKSNFESRERYRDALKMLDRHNISMQSYRALMRSARGKQTPQMACLRVVLSMLY